jgi:hypothetical protein
MLQEAMKNTTWNQSYQELIDVGIQNMPLASVKRLLRLANDFVYTCKTYAQVIVNELNMSIDKKTIKPATDIGGIAGGEKYVVQGTHTHTHAHAPPHAHARTPTQEDSPQHSQAFSSSFAWTRKCRPRARVCGSMAAVSPRRRRPPRLPGSNCRA